GLPIEPLLDAILPLFELDAYVDSPLVMMDVVEGDTADPDVGTSYQQVADTHQPNAGKIALIDRFAFYDRAREAFAVVMTGDTRKYSNIILKKGVTPN
ncbi:MAG: RbsD/FucU domain-containing protein, partial [Planctomycetota bacterium]|nr:RbsD/FucU domain-containing protein [Planctomycetota bacterium]